MRIAIGSCALFILLAVAASLAHAESVVWMQVQPDLWDKGDHDRSSMYLFDPGVSVTYNVSAWEVDEAGTKLRALPSGSSVLVGTRVLFEFIPHQYTDISWFGIGGAYDDPYGNWRPNAARPSSAQHCTPQNLYDEQVRYQDDDEDEDGSFLVDLYASLSVAPPTSKAITLSGASASCTTAGSNKTCVLY
jgi:hypothetical protein